ncbi:MAG: methyltransferase domain-containing protein [Candidatus Omnitrophica bacterium]|nr:methyltransferase domain-containing protein [Candidatus Omnitrophota bacterium]
MIDVFSKYSVRYDRWYDVSRQAYFSELEALRKVMPKFGKGLEIGVGTGRFAQALGITLGIDPSAEMLRIADRRGVNTRRGFGEDLPFWHGSFDYVAIIIALCFVDDPLKVLEEAKRVLQNNGRIILAVVDKNSFLGKYYLKKKSIFYKNARFFSIREISKMLNKLGFKKLSYFQTIFDLPEKINSVQKPIKGCGKGGFVVISGQKCD